MQHFDSATESIARRELTATEQLLWCGRPATGRASQRAIPQAVVGGCILAFALFWMAQAFFITSAGRGMGAPGFSMLFPLFGLIFVFVGVRMIFSPATEAAKASHTVYAITTERALVIEGDGATTVKSYAPRDMNALERREQSDGSGDVVFARRQHQRYRDGHRRTYTEDIGFFGIPNAREVERLLREHLQRGI